MILEAKKELRVRLRELAKGFRAEQLALWSALIMSELEQLERFKGASTVALFCSLADEPSTAQFIEKWRKSKRIILPVVSGDSMTMRELVEGCVLSEGAYNILEPSIGPVCPIEEIDLIVVPGVAFDSLGHRLGRGKGYYDRYLSSGNIYKVGVCFSFRLLPLVPNQAHDIVMDRIITDLK